MKPLIYDLIKGNVKSEGSLDINIIVKSSSGFSFEDTPHDLTIIKFTASIANMLIRINKHIKKQFKFYMHGSGNVLVRSTGGNSEALNYDTLYTYTPVNWTEGSDSIKIGELSDGNRTIDVYINEDSSGK